MNPDDMAITLLFAVFFVGAFVGSVSTILIIKIRRAF